jgi:enoyl-CoA hydratase/carnithine racemase
MSYDTLKIDREGPLTWLTLNRPERLNAISDQMLLELDDALEALARDDDTRVIAIRGEGRAFSSGYDIASDSDEVGGAHDRDITEDRLRLTANIDTFLKIWDHPKPVIAAVHGYCLAGATQLCVFCDVTVLSEDATIGLPSIPIGGGYITPLWTWLVGPKRAKQMSFVAGSTIDGKTACDWGWANYAVPADQLEDDVRRLATEIAKIPGPILTVKKLAINRTMEVQGFRASAPMGADLDALLHASAPVQQLNELIVEHGLKEAIQRFDRGDWRAERGGAGPSA